MREWRREVEHKMEERPTDESIYSELHEKLGIKEAREEEEEARSLCQFPVAIAHAPSSASVRATCRVGARVQTPGQLPEEQTIPRRTDE